jgi:hypothetical protein
MIFIKQTDVEIDLNSYDKRKKRILSVGFFNLRGRFSIE